MENEGLFNETGSSVNWWGVSWILAAVILIFIGLIAAGVFDPRPLGDRVIATKPGDLTIPARASTYQWHLCAGPQATYSVRGVGIHSLGEQDMVYGIAIGDQEDHLSVGVSPLGYVTIQHNNRVLLPLQTWPHVGPVENEIWIDVRQEDMTVRINREILWQGTVKLPSHHSAVWGESFAEKTTIHFPNLSCYAANKL